MAEVARDGFWVGRVPLGYRLARTPGEHGAGKRRRSGRLVIDEERAPIVREAFERYADGESTTALAAWLGKVARPPRAPAWGAQTVRDLLMNRVYAGTIVFGRRARGKHVRLGADGRSAPQEPDRGEGNLDAALVRHAPGLAIVGEELFERVQARLAAGRRRGYHKAAGVEPLPLSGLGKCGACGGVLISWSASRGKVRRLSCANRHRYGTAACPDGSTGCSHDLVLRHVMALLADTLLASGAAERLTALAEERVDEARRAHEATRNALLRRLAELDATLDRSRVGILDIPDDLREDFEIGLRRVKQQRADTAAELEKLQQRKATPEGIDPARFRRFWERFREAHALYQGAGEAYSPSLRPLLAELVTGFTLHFSRDRRGRCTPARVEVELPGWLTLLAGSACRPW
jgi:hypothetical protein